ncbi:DUF2059 domain-containing protein [Pseudoprimorskyibacter insulae]|uniref:DUF2059 domain-containing protein n=1 Tax=Pseudoprimorskyibacter insulae TaxID=1695997 RepID=A0A2R8AZ48_9RHOB|nr:DUF2059 domain-containing protein [Pseudoprimorskyibacter insulae]SPF81312.1 hypothetical protein PRI8871_03134 [Pseudoprimorskyibacter insulae]
MIRFISLVAALFTLVAGPVRAGGAEALMSALRMDDMVALLRDEGLIYGDDLAASMLPDGATEAWKRNVSDIYDTGAMKSVIQAQFDAELSEDDIAPLLSFFETDIGRRIVGLEMSARRAISDPSVEEASRDFFTGIDGTDDPRLAAVTRYVEANDLVDYNVVSALNSQFHFYRGLIEGGALDMDLNEVVADIWSDEDNTRQDTRDWVYAYLLMAYQPLPEDELNTYIALSHSAEGQSLNRVLFGAFDKMYNDISYQLGLAIARQMDVRDL